MAKLLVEFLLCVLCVFYHVSCDTFFGKLILKTPTVEKRHSIFEKTPAVFATRRSTFLKKNGDVFKIHIPGILQNASTNTVSFESMRFPEYFLAQDKKQNRFKIIQRNISLEPNFDAAASFFVERRAGIEGSGMLRLSSDPSKYMCVRKEKFTESALQAIEKENTNDFKYRCSFFLQKLRDENVGVAINKSIAEGGHKKSNIAGVSTSPSSSSKLSKVVSPKGVSIDGLLAAFNKKLEFHQKTLKLEAAAALQKKKAAFLTSESASKKAKINPKVSVIPSKRKNLIHHPASVEQIHRAETALPKSSLKKVIAPLSKKDAASPHILFPQKSQANQMPNMVMGVKGNLYYNGNNHQNKNVDVVQSNTRPLMKKANNLGQTSVIGGQKQAANVLKQKETPASKGETRLIGPKVPVDLHDFPITHNHREPALNLDGLVHSVKLPATRSKIATLSTNDTKARNRSNDNVKTHQPLHPPLNHQTPLASNRSVEAAKENVFFNVENATHAEKVELEEGQDKNKSIIAERIDDQISLTKNSTPSALAPNKNSTSTPEHANITTSLVINNSTVMLQNTTNTTTVNATKYEKNSTVNAQLNATNTGGMLANKNRTVLKPDEKNTTIQNVSAAANLVNSNNKTIADPMNSTKSNVGASVLNDKNKLNATENVSLINETLGGNLKNASSIHKISNDSSRQLVNNSTMTKSNTTAGLTANNTTTDSLKNQTSSLEKNTTTASSATLLPNNSTVMNATSRHIIHHVQEHHTLIMKNESSATEHKGFLATPLSSLTNTTFELIPNSPEDNSKAEGAGKKNQTKKMEDIDQPDEQQINKINSTSEEEEKYDISPESPVDESKKNTTGTASGDDEKKNATLTQHVADKKNTTSANVDSSIDAKPLNGSTNNSPGEILKNSSSSEQIATSSKNQTTTDAEATKNATSSNTFDGLSSDKINGTMSLNQTAKEHTEDKKNTTIAASPTNTTETATLNQISNKTDMKEASKLNRTYQVKDLLTNPEGSPMMRGRFPIEGSRQRMINSSISYGGSITSDGLAQDVNAAFSNNSGFDSPDEQNAMLMQNVQGAVRKINEEDVKMVSQKMLALEKEDRATAPSMEKILGADNNPHVKNLLLGGYGVNQTMGFENNTSGGARPYGSAGEGGEGEGDDAYTRSGMEMMNPQQQQYMVNGTMEEENGDSRSHLYKPKKGFLMSAVSRDKVLEGNQVLEKPGIDGNHHVHDHDHDHNHDLVHDHDHVNDHDHDFRNDFHQKPNELSHTDKDRFNELNHAESGSELHHYHNDDSMHPPTIQHSDQINDLHHQTHGYVNDDAMSPPEHHLPHDYYHASIHHGEPHDYPTEDAAHIKHIATDHGTDDIHHPLIGSPVEHPTTLYESDHYIPGKDTGIVSSDDINHVHLDDETNLQHHTHHVVTVKNEAEKQKMVHGLVDIDKDKCVSLQIVNDIGHRYRLISSINKHGYTPRGQLFTLKTVFKDPSMHKLVLFKAVDELEPGRQLLLEGKDKFVAFPTSCDAIPKTVHITRVGQRPSIVGCGSSVAGDCSTKKDTISNMNKMKQMLGDSYHTHQQQRKPLDLANVLLGNTKRSNIPISNCQQRTYNERNPSSQDCCVFPFMFGGLQHNECIKSGMKSWCGTTDNVDRDKKWGICTPQTGTDVNQQNTSHFIPAKL